MRFGRKSRKCQRQKKLPAVNKIALYILHQRLGHKSTKSLLAEDTDNVWKNIELRIYPDPFFTSCQIASMNKKLVLTFH